MSAECMEMALVDGKMTLIRSGLPKNDVRNIRNPSLTPSAPVSAVVGYFSSLVRLEFNRIISSAQFWFGFDWLMSPRKQTKRYLESSAA